MEQIAEQRMEHIPDLVQTIINTTMEIERQKYLKAGRYEHHPERIGHSNGYKPKTLKTRLGKPEFSLYYSGFYFLAVEKELRSERALSLTLAEMYV